MGIKKPQLSIESPKWEERFRSYFELPLIGIAITSPEKGWIEVNDRLCKIFGYPRKELTKMNWVEITHPEDIEEDINNFNRVLSGEIEGYSIEKRFVKKSGKIIHADISVRCVRLTGKKSGADYFVALVQDITDRKKMEIELSDYRSTLEQQVKTRTEQLNQLNKTLEDRVNRRTVDLKNKNIALREISAQIEIEKNNLKVSVSNKVNKILMPLLKTIGQKSTGIDAKYINLIEKKLNEITLELDVPLKDHFLTLTSRELEICSMISGGMRTKEIASLLSLSAKTVDAHRYKIRKKLKIKEKNINLVTYLKKYH